MLRCVSVHMPCVLLFCMCLRVLACACVCLRVLACACVCLRVLACGCVVLRCAALCCVALRALRVVCSCGHHIEVGRYDKADMYVGTFILFIW